MPSTTCSMSAARSALVTGGASGLGYAFAEILAEAGANVVIADWDEAALKKAVGSLADAAAASGRAPQPTGRPVRRSSAAGRST